jgi:phage tail-like protein
MPGTTVASAEPSTNGASPYVLGELGFVVEIPGVEIGRFTECSGLAVEYEVLEYAEGGNNMYTHRLRGRAKYPALTLRRGVTSEDGLLKWFFEYQKGAQRPTLTVTMVDPSGKSIRRFAFASAFPIKWTGPDGGFNNGSAATESLEIGHLGLV